jgi:hypothetical protein
VAQDSFKKPELGIRRTEPSLNIEKKVVRTTTTSVLGGKSTELPPKSSRV